MENENKSLTTKTDLKSFIVPTKLENTDEEQKYGDSSFDTKDLIYLESLLDVKNIQEEERVVYPTDYAVMNGCERSRSNSGFLGKRTCKIWLRTATADDKLYVHFMDSIGYDKSEIVWIRQMAVCPALRLDLSKVVSARKLSQDIFKTNAVANKNGRVLYHTIEFGEYPKSYVGEMKNKGLEKLYSENKLFKTSKSYTGMMDKHGEYEFYPEFEYQGQKYVRFVAKYNVEAHIRTEMMISTSKTQPPIWVKVEPITWKIKNWEQMPFSINPQGTGSADFIDLRSENGITSGIPFYTDINDENCSMWQNSVIRARLNGYNLHREIAGGNGNSKYIAEKNFDFTKHNFLNEAFSTVTFLKKEAVNTKRKNAFGVRIANKPLSVDEQIKFYIEKGKSFMLHGPSGVGKTRRIEEADPEFVSIVLRNGILPEEVIGKTIYLSDDKTKAGKWVAPAWYQDLCEKCAREPNKNHVLFIDEITNVRPSEQSLVFHLVLNHSIGPNVGKLPDNVVVVAAGNSMEESESAYNMPEPLFRRFDAHIYLKPDIQQWLEWGSQPSGKGDRLKIHPLVANFVASNCKKVFYSPYDSEEPPKYAVDPRAWEQISDIIYDNDGCISMELVANKAGKDIAVAFVDFVKNLPITVQDVVEGNFVTSEIPMNFDAKFALAMSLRNANFEQIVKVREFVGKYLGNEILATFDSIWVEKSDEKAIFLQKLKQKQTESQTEKQQ